LQINFVESCAGDLSSLQTVRRVPPVMLISSGPCEWSATSDVWAQGAELNVIRPVVSSALDEAVVRPIEDAIRRNGVRSLTVPLTGAGWALRTALYTIRMMRSVATQNASMPEAELPPNYGMEALVELINNCLASVNADSSHGALRSRLHLARSIEKLLWTSPLDRREELDFSLEEVASHFRCSRRQVQMALQETFGLGFVALRRIIRLHQFRNAISRAGVGGTISSLASDFYFSHFGRLASEYRELFGTLPSEDRRLALTGSSPLV